MIDNIIGHRQEIILGEIGALLHDIGKCHPDFIGKNSVENTPKNFDHSKIIDFLNSNFISLIKNDKFKIKINNNETDIYSLITEHHNNKNSNPFIQEIQSCDRLDSADDKGVVRRKQPQDSTIITSPFGFPKEKIDLQCLKRRLDDLQSNLIELFQNYTTGNMDITCFRSSIVTNVKKTFSHALGETRIPANDVTLWDHSHSTASLFKSVLCSMALGETLILDKLKWRILGFCWDGIRFINKGKKIGDILTRNEIIEEIKNKLQNEFENEIPIGNVIYEDNNGIYFTFPALSNNSEILAKECIETGLKIIRNTSNDELWPFFTLSKASRTMTILTDELRFADEKRKIPKMTPILFIEEKGGEILDNPEMPVSKNGEDICPVCRIRTKPVENERCDVCEKRREGRLDEWKNKREETIWMDEVADKNNRIALLNLNFDLERWLDGTMVKTLFSQTFEDWKNSKKWQPIQNILVEANKDYVYKIIEEILRIKDTDKERAAKLLDTFFEENIGLNKNNLDEHYSNIEGKIQPNSMTKNNLSAYLFSQNPSPARLHRIWTETREFFDLFINEIKSKVYSQKWKRICFEVDTTNFNPDKSTTYIIKKIELKPDNLLVLHTSNGEFYTIESLEKYKFQDKSGVEAVKEVLSKRKVRQERWIDKTSGVEAGKEALSEEEDWIAKEEDKLYNYQLKNGQNIKINGILSEEEYYPFIELTKSPLSLRLIVPAADSAKIMNLAIKLYNNRFEKVLGKLPLNMSLLVANRKFPLYVLLEAGGRMFRNKKFKESEIMDAWWDINGLKTDNYYDYYPVNKKDSYNLDDLSPLSKGKSFALYPGYFDFDLLLGTNDRFNIIYNNKKRAANDYKLYSKRPYYLYQYTEMVDLWEILNNNISNSQINFIEEMLTNKLREWRNVNEYEKKDIFKKFTETTIKDAFSNKWNQLRKETQDFILNSAHNGLLLDTIFLFMHTT